MRVFVKNRLNKSFIEDRLDKSSTKNRFDKSSLILLFAFTRVLFWEFLIFAFVISIANNIKIKNKNKNIAFKILLFIVYINTFRKFSF